MIDKRDADGVHDVDDLQLAEQARSLQAGIDEDPAHKAARRDAHDRSIVQLLDYFADKDPDTLNEAVASGWRRW